MNMLRNTSIVAAALLFAAPALAQSGYSSGDARIDRWSEQGRRATGSVGYATGYRMCGARCARGMRGATNGVYVGSRYYANRYGESLRDFGRRARERYEDSRRRRR